MQFINDGPDVPDELLRAHEEGKVIFFCGAGISYPAGLPGFEDLVKKIYKHNHTWREIDEDTAFEHKQFDTTLDLLERRLPGGRARVLQAIYKALQPQNNIFSTHYALLRLGRNRDERLRLITTNFDRLFHIASENDNSLKFESYEAPLLPIPKDNHWDGLVFLHGLLPEKYDEVGLNNLVVTSGDFGLAYLVERWAARFVSELFRNYTVCFVGYSLNDPILRYMTDALAADKRRGNNNHQAWAFAGYNESANNSKNTENKQKTEAEWRAKGVRPILYRIPSDNSANHDALHDTLVEWAQLYIQDLKDKEEIIEKYAQSLSRENNEKNNLVSRVLWALSDPSGLPAKRFAELNPTLEWLDIFSEKHFTPGDLSQFSVNSGSWDDIRYNLTNWMLNNLSNPKLLVRVIKQHVGKPHPSFVKKIQEKLFELYQLRLNNQNSNPPLLEKLWLLFQSGDLILLDGQQEKQSDEEKYEEERKFIKENNHLFDWLYCVREAKKVGTTVFFRRTVMDLFKPRVGIKIKNLSLETKDNLSINDLIDWELIVGLDIKYTFDIKEEIQKNIQADLLDIFQHLLLEVLDLMHEMGRTDEQYNIPSIHSIDVKKENNYYQWFVLVELLREIWLKLWQQNQKHACQIAYNWFKSPYITFKRLALFAASHDCCISSRQWLKWLCDDNAKILWLESTQQEVYKLLIDQEKNLSDFKKKKLAKLILKGPKQPSGLENIIDRDRQKFESDKALWQELIKSKKLSTSCLEEILEVYFEWISKRSDKVKTITKEDKETTAQNVKKLTIYSENSKEIKNLIISKLLFLIKEILADKEKKLSNNLGKLRKSTGLNHLSSNDLAEIAETLYTDLTLQHRESCWENYILPFWKHIWPKHKKFISPEVCYNLVKLVLETDTEFPNALEYIEDWLLPMEENGSKLGSILSDLDRKLYGQKKYLESESNKQQNKHLHLKDKLEKQNENYLQAALKLLDSLIKNNHHRLYTSNLKRCLDKIKEANQDLAKDNRFQRLWSYVENPKTSN